MSPSHGIVVEGLFPVKVGIYEHDDYNQTAPNRKCASVLILLLRLPVRNFLGLGLRYTSSKVKGEKGSRWPGYKGLV